MSQKINILVVDDEQIILDSIRKLLKDEDYTIFTVSSVNDGLDKIKDSAINIVLTDLMMPEIDGYDTTRVIKEHLPDLPIIMQTAFTSVNANKKSIEAGAEEFITKPIDPQELFKLINKYFST